MLEHLQIRNFALIENLSMDLSEGFNVITGETGAGKSIILGALGLLMGEKADSGAIRTGAEEIDVNAVISIPSDHEANQILQSFGAEAEDGQIIIRRKVRRNGRSMITVQGQNITRAELAQLADSLIDMHGQSEHQSLLSSDKQRRIVDSYAGNGELLHRCRDLYEKLQSLKEREQEILGDIEESRRQEDYLRFAVEEINSIKPETGEDEALKDRIKVLGQYESIVESSQLGTEKLREAKAALYDAYSAMAKAAKADPLLSDYVQRVESSRFELEDIEQGVSDYISHVDYSDSLIDSLQERLNSIQKLKRKYGPEIENVLFFAEDAKNKLELVENSEGTLDECKKDIAKAQKEYDEVSSQLSVRRRKASSVLQKEIEKVLRTLGMPNAVFVIDVVTDSTHQRTTGCDSIAFNISANPGEDSKPIKEIASGGELSRVMLALKTVLAQSDSIQTQVFDEVDSGIGGAVALSLASCISDLARSRQVIAITHLAGVASRADSHFVVSKTVEGGRTYTSVSVCEGEDRVREIARMLSGDQENVSLELARQMIFR